MHWIEDVQADCRSEHDVRKFDYSWLTVEQIEDFGLADVPEDLEENSDILDPMYEKNKVSSTPLPLIQWSQKECTSIRAHVQSILTNTNVWLSLHGVPIKLFSPTSDDDTAGPMGKRAYIRTKNKQDLATSTKDPKLKFTVGSKKGKNQGEPLSSNVQEISELEVSDKQEENDHPDEELIHGQEDEQEQNKLDVEEMP